MNITGNTILITGGGSGIGRGLAEAFHAAGNRVVIAGRRMGALEEVMAANPGIKGVTLDVGDQESIRAVAGQMTREFPTLNVLINNAGIMRREDLTAGELADAQAMVETNLLGPMRLTAALLPLLMGQGRSTIMNVTSGLAFVPLAMTPTYCATKAGLHSYTMSLRWQLCQTAVEVIELIPPYVQTHLMGARQEADPRAMELDEFIKEVMGILRAQAGMGGLTEVCVERVKGMRLAAVGGKLEGVFRRLNEAMGAAT